MKKEMEKQKEIIVIYSRNAWKKIFNAFSLHPRGLNLALTRLFYLPSLLNVDYLNGTILSITIITVLLHPDRIYNARINKPLARFKSFIATIESSCVKKLFYVYK